MLIECFIRFILDINLHYFMKEDDCITVVMCDCTQASSAYQLKF